MKAELNMEEDIHFEEEHPEIGTNTKTLKLFRKNVDIDGMINLTGQGDRFAVLKATNRGEGKQNSKTFGRIQIRKSDEVRR